ncbi:vesicle transport protein SFT2C [Macrotis lagotis]|uniref:vesicle transport protein SFT2C n=1 Tax=Macrotis lagotis TaxID=92651 RepID=UPI003D69CB02
MADLNRQLQEYLAHSKGAGSAGAAAAPLLPPEAAEAGRPSLVGAWLPGRAWGWARGRAARPEEPEPEAEAGAGPACSGPACCAGLSRWQRLAAGGACLALAALCFGLAALFAPALPLRARKFALLWSLGSASALAAAALLRGGPACLRLLRGEERPPRAALLYLAALGGTLYAALALRSTALTALGAAAQVGFGLAALPALLPWGGGPALRHALGGLRGGLGRALPV